ncbi:MAG TPA: gamma-glutamyl-gamma-aminobutyrate hydrolase family protein [Puia sp.]|nr:gamma-glutamyl-gamma-aminobutyrate hydrolase family protein [Puia sp.]
MKIGLTYTGSDEKHNNYVRWIQQQDADIEVVKLSVEGGDVTECDALVLSGGVDIHPDFYGGGNGYSAGLGKGPVKWNKDRDHFEIAALKRAWEQGKPVLGVCRGLQLINVVCAGTLVQDLGVQGDETHQNTPADKQHGVTIEKDSLLFDISGGGGEVNSAHHQAIDKLGEGLRVNCHSDDGVIEGVEWADPHDKPFMLAVQWHPERMFTNGLPDRELYMDIRNRFIEEIKKTIEQ